MGDFMELLLLRQRRQFIGFDSSCCQCFLVTATCTTATAITTARATTAVTTGATAVLTAKLPTASPAHTILILDFGAMA